MKNKKCIVLFVLTINYLAANAQDSATNDTLTLKDEKSIYNQLFSYANTLNVIDAHEHMISAENHAKRYLSFWDFFSSYVKWDLYGAGMPKKYLDYMPENEGDVTALFNIIEPYLPSVEYGSYMLSVKMALKKYFGIDKITRSNYIYITRKLNENNTVENYYKVFKDAHIVKLLNQCYSGKTTAPLYANITTISWQFNMENTITKMCRANKKMTLKDVTALYDKEIKKEKDNGAYGIKFFPHVFIEPYDTTIAKQQFEQIKNGKAFNERSTLSRYIFEEEIKIATKYKMIIAIHWVFGAILPTNRLPSCFLLCQNTPMPFLMYTTWAYPT